MATTHAPSTYKIPATGDVPGRFRIELWPEPNPEDNVFRSKAVGEPPFMLTISVWQALRDAASAARGGGAGGCPTKGSHGIDARSAHANRRRRDAAGRHGPAPERQPRVRPHRRRGPGVAAAADFIRQRRGVDRINLIGWSWGTSIMALYTSANNDKVRRLVLYAPQWIRTTASLVATGAGPVPAYRVVDMNSARTRWLSGVAPDKQKDLIPTGWFDTWARETVATNPWGSKQNPPVLRAPNGVVEDGLRYYSAGNGIYDPAAIRVPTLLVKAEWDTDTPAYMAQALFPKLVNAPYRRYVEIGEGTHTVIMEKNRMQLFREVQQFLDEPAP